MENISKIKLIAVDIDGTIMNRQYQISERMRNTILRAIDAGIYVVLATGRMYSATVPIASGLGIRTPLITYQGGMIREFYNSDEVLLHYTMDPDISRDVIRDIRKFNTQINVYLDDEMFVEDESHILREYVGRRHIVYHKVDSFDTVLDFKPTKVLAIDDTAVKTDEIISYLQKKYDHSLYVTKSMPTYCEIVNNKASKGNAILYLAKLWEINKSEIMVIGDQDNDIEMLEVAGLPVAMGNATDNLKKVAKYITDTVDNDGAAVAIEKFALEQKNESTI